MKLTFAMDVPHDHPYTAGIKAYFCVNVVNRPQKDKTVPMNSMTGFATTSGQIGDSDWRLDVKSVNGRGLDLRFRLPPGFESLEQKLRLSAQNSLKRGTVTVSLIVRFQHNESLTSLDEAALSRSVKALAVARTRLEEAGIPLAATRAEALLTLPGILVNTEGNEPPGFDALKKEILVGFENALQALLKERSAEGSRLAHVIASQVTQIESLTSKAKASANEAVIALRERFKTQLTTLLSDTALSPERLQQEAAILASKADISEEIDRLYAHVAAARALLAMAEPIGRRLEFLTQEFNREANTLCSKSPTDALTRIGLDLKAVVDQVKEQAANIE